MKYLSYIVLMVLMLCVLQGTSMELVDKSNFLRVLQRMLHRGHSETKAEAGSTDWINSRQETVQKRDHTMELSAILEIIPELQKLICPTVEPEPITPPTKKCIPRWEHQCAWSKDCCDDSDRCNELMMCVPK